MATGKKRIGKTGRDGKKRTTKRSPASRKPLVDYSAGPAGEGSTITDGPNEKAVVVPEPSAVVDEDSERAFPIVGIGASAGGVEAFTDLLRHLPVDTGMGFVFVQHLSPVHESILTEILSRATSMPVREIQNNMLVEPNHLYVIPPNANLGILHGILHLLPRDEGQKHQYMSIDYFFNALATDRSSRAIGVILSGTASDGALGLKAIKSEGGITFAQDERSAKYDGMPRSAVAAGYVDFVLPPAEIAAELARLGHHPYVRHPHPDNVLPAPLEEDNDFNRIVFILRSATGVDFTYYKESTIKRRVLRRMFLHRIENQHEYIRFLQRNADEVENLYNDILINVTGFFRDSETFDALGQFVFPRILEGRANNSIVRIWVPACSSGEEAYSLAIALLEYLGEKAGQTTIQIFATDISDLALEKARAGIYPETISADVSQERLLRFFTKTDGGYQIRKSLRDMCIFAKQNVLKDPPFSRIDLISCRNLLIYLGAVLHKKVIPLFYYALNPKGVLILGTSETIGGSSHLFSLLDKRFRYYVKKRSSQPQPIEVATPADSSMKQEKAYKKAIPPREWKAFDLQHEVDQTLLGKYVPPSVVINDDLEIIFFRGRIGSFLEPAAGKASLNILKMVREGLVPDLRSTILKAKKENRTTRHEGVIMREDGHLRSVNIEVIPLRNAETKERFFLVLFQYGALTAEPVRLKKGKSGKVGTTANQREVARLRHELVATKAYLQSIIEEQEATNEELRTASEESQSGNEELQSTNEELETAKEELQSTNEELNTVNETLENRNEELNQLNNDLMNLLSSVHIPIIMLGSDLRIRRFTPSAERVLNVIRTDVGRKISDLRPNIVMPDLEQTILSVIETLRMEEREVKDNNGFWYTMRIRPYKTAENKIDGAVLAFSDINEVKQAGERLKLLNELGNSLMQVMQDPVVVIDPSLRITSVNPAFTRVFGIPRERAEGELFSELHGRAWHIPDVQEVIGRALTGTAEVAERDVRVDLPGLGPRDYALVARPIMHADRSVALVLLVIRVRSQESEAGRGEQ